MRLFRRQDSQSCSDTYFWDPSQPPQPGGFQYSCTEPEYCPFGISEGGPQKCCPFTNAIVCCNGDCISTGDCAPCETPPPLTPTPDPTPEPSPSSVIPPSSVAPSPSENPTNECDCKDDWYCSTNGYAQCCPEEGMAYCADAITCYRESDGQLCCGNTLCWEGQICAPGGNSCIITSTLATVASTSDSPTSNSPTLNPSTSDLPTRDSTASPSSTQAASSSLDETTASQRSTAPPSPVDADKTRSEAIIPTTASNSQESSVLDVLQTAVPQSVQSDPAGACFLNTAYTTYTTPSWYTVMPSNAQSYFASVNAENTAACVAGSGGGSSLSPGAKAGIGVGVAVGLAGLGGLIYLLIKLGMIGGSSAAAGGSSAAAAAGTSSAAPPPTAWNGITGPEWSGVTGSGASPPVPSNVPVPPITAAAAIRRLRDSDGRINTATAMYSPPTQRSDSNFSAAQPQSPFGSGSYQQHNNAYYPPPRSVSPPDMNPTEMDNASPHSELHGERNRMSEVGGPGLSRELWAGGAMQGGHEISGNERFEAPGGNWR